MSSSGIPLGLSWLASTPSNWAPGARPLDPYLSFNFAIEIEALLVGGFSEVSGLESEIQVDDYQEGGVNDFVHKLPRQTTYSNLVLKHGLTDISTLWNWYYNTSKGFVKRKNGTIMLLDRKQIPVMWWNFRNALPVRWRGPDFDAGSDDIAFETIELVHEGLSKPLLGQAATLVRGALHMARVEQTR